MTNFTRWVGRLSFVALGAAVLLASMPSDADARRGGGFGSRGSKTFKAPPATNTAPKATAPINKSITQPGAPTAANQAMRPGAGAATQASRFGGMRGLLMGGLFAAALAGIFGMGALASIAGFMLQLLLVGGIIFLLVRLFRGGFGSKPAVATAGAPSAYTGRNPADMLNRAGSAGGGAAGSDDVKIGPPDYDSFERLLSEVQQAYGRNDVDGLEKLLTPEMLSYFAGELDDNAKNGVLNVVSDVQLLQGDLSEAWREQNLEYATVALRYSLLDAIVETATGRVVEGSKTEPTELTEVWTFVRPARGSASQWELSAIQSAS